MWLAERHQIRRHLEKAVCLVAGDLLLPVGDLHAHDDGRDRRRAFTRENQRVIQRGAETANSIRGQDNTRWAGCPAGGWIWSGRLFRSGCVCSSVCASVRYAATSLLIGIHFLNLAEKFAITHAEKYFIAGEHLLLPAIEYIYIWNLFAIIEKDKRLVTPILDRVEKKIGQYKNESGRWRTSSVRFCDWSGTKQFAAKSASNSNKITQTKCLSLSFKCRVWSTVHGQHLSANASERRLSTNARLPVPGSGISAAGSQAVCVAFNRRLITTIGILIPELAFRPNI